MSFCFACGTPKNVTNLSPNPRFFGSTHSQEISDHTGGSNFGSAIRILRLLRLLRLMKVLKALLQSDLEWAAWSLTVQFLQRDDIKGGRYVLFISLTMYFSSSFNCAGKAINCINHHINVSSLHK